ncbi:hypothetical protein Tco_1130632 [Tanacetum coccineum]
MHSTPSMYYDYDAHVKGELLVIMKNSQSVNLLIFISNTLIELFNDFGSDRDGILKRPTMYFNLWRYKVVRHRYSNPMIQPELEGSTQGYPLVSVEVLRKLKDGGEDFRYSDTIRLSSISVLYFFEVDKGIQVKNYKEVFVTSDTERLSRTDKVKVKELQERSTNKSFSSQQIKKGMSMLVQKSQVHKMAKFTRWRNEIMLG